MSRSAHRRFFGWLLLSLGWVLTQTLGWCVPARADERVLVVRDDEEVRRYSVKDLAGTVGLEELRVAADPHFGPDRTFAGFALKALVDGIGLGDAAELLLVCEDGYRIPFDMQLLSNPSLEGLLAIRDATMPADGEKHWPPFRAEGRSIDFDPFYLVWSSSDASIDLGTQSIPWPFQLTEIQRFDRERYFAPARPPAGADAALEKGFGLYTKHCGKCHRVRGVGGDVGPALDRAYSLSSVLTPAQLHDYVEHEESRFPASRMPSFSKLLTAEQIDQIVAYLRAMQPAN